MPSVTSATPSAERANASGRVWRISASRASRSLAAGLSCSLPAPAGPAPHTSAALRWSGEVSGRRPSGTVTGRSLSAWPAPPKGTARAKLAEPVAIEISPGAARRRRGDRGERPSQASTGRSGTMSLRMAQTATLYALTVDLSHVDRGVYETLDLRVARHPSESAEYMVTRILAYCLEYREGIAFTEGLSSGDDPPVLVRDLTGRITAGSRWACRAPTGCTGQQAGRPGGRLHPSRHPPGARAVRRRARAPGRRDSHLCARPRGRRRLRGGARSAIRRLTVSVIDATDLSLSIGHPVDAASMPLVAHAGFRRAAPLSPPATPACYGCGVSPGCATRR